MPEVLRDVKSGRSSWRKSLVAVLFLARMRVPAVKARGASRAVARRKRDDVAFCRSVVTKAGGAIVVCFLATLNSD